MHWATEYIGLPWIASERDCWAFFRDVQRTHFGREVPAIDLDSYAPLHVVRVLNGHAERQRWRQVETPSCGDGVLMGRNEQPAHVGVWLDIDTGRVLHCAEGIGVLCQDVASLRANGWGSITWWTPCS